MVLSLNRKIRTAFTLIKSPYMFLTRMGVNGLLNWLPDKTFLKIAYRGHTGRKLNLQDPQRYTEKLQWLKLYNRNPVHTKLVDKYEIRNYLKNKVGEKLFVRLYGVYDRFDDIDWNTLPDAFIMKCTHGCGCNYIVHDKNDIDKKNIKKKFNKWLRVNPYYQLREWVYRDVTPKIIIEELLDNNGGLPVDYKFYCFDGYVYCCRMQYFIEGIKYQNYLNLDFEDIGVVDAMHLPHALVPDKPNYYDELIQLAEKLSKGMKHVRIDFLGTDDDFYMGEFTFFTTSGYSIFTPDSFDYEMGKLIKL